MIYIGTRAQESAFLTYGIRDAAESENKYAVPIGGILEYLHSCDYSSGQYRIRCQLGHGPTRTHRRLILNRGNRPKQI